MNLIKNILNFFGINKQSDVDLNIEYSSLKSSPLKHTRDIPKYVPQSSHQTIHRQTDTQRYGSSSYNDKPVTSYNSSWSSSYDYSSCDSSSSCCDSSSSSSCD
jgi:hypothetical protein